ncbi:glutamine synthetase/guanido kinase [Hymenopellis radicata]|nr:glutamine synthetase/guanido kinase [Hymenopellis radicata]
MSSSDLAPSDLAGLGISYVRVIWIDFTNITRCRVISLKHFLKMMQSARPGVALAFAVMSMVDLRLAAGVSAVGEWFYVIDTSTLRICPYEEGLATVMGNFQHKVPVLVNGSPSLQVDVCPRTILERVVTSAKRDASVEFLVGFETEFILLKSTRPIGGAHEHLYAACNGLLTGSVESRILREISDSLIGGGIDVSMYHPEAAPGQYELITGPLPPLQAADALVYTRETITNHAKAIPAVTLPLPASYQRMTDGVWSGGTYICWGTDNRETPIRLTNLESPLSGTLRFALSMLHRTLYYLALAMILGTGAHGVKHSEPLAAKDLNGLLSAAQMTPEDRVAFGITERFPLTWDAAREAFAKNELSEAILGKSVVSHYLSVQELMAASLESESDEEKKATKLVECF